MKKKNTCSCRHAYCCVPPAGKTGKHCGEKGNGCLVRAGKKIRTPVARAPVKRRKPQGPKCEVCGAVMSPRSEGGPDVCWFTGSHADILAMRMETAEKTARKKRGKKNPGAGFR